MHANSVSGLWCCVLAGGGKKPGILEIHDHVPLYGKFEEHFPPPGCHAAKVPNKVRVGCSVNRVLNTGFSQSIDQCVSITEGLESIPETGLKAGDNRGVA